MDHRIVSVTPYDEGYLIVFENGALAHLNRGPIKLYTPLGWAGRSGGIEIRGNVFEKAQQVRGPIPVECHYADEALRTAFFDGVAAARKAGV